MADARISKKVRARTTAAKKQRIGLLTLLSDQRFCLETLSMGIFAELLYHKEQNKNNLLIKKKNMKTVNEKFIPKRLSK